jgi:hypothetical protein
MLLLPTTSDSLELVTSAAVAVDYVASWADHSSSGVAASAGTGQVSTATTTTIVAAPGASTQRQIRGLTLRNAGSADVTVTVQAKPSGTARTIVKAAIQPGETLAYSDGRGWYSLDSAGRERTQRSDASTAGYAVWAHKVGAAPEAAGIWHSHHASTGTPGTWSPGTPGVAGRATDGTTTADDGVLKLPTAGAGLSLYLTQMQSVATVACQVMLFDFLWVNSGLVVTTTTAQTVNSVSFPARDIDGSTTGNGVGIAVLVTAATTNAGAITNMTMSYTNSAGTGSRTATMASFPATAVAGTLVPFQLAAGDEGVQSVQSVTLGTSLVTGSISLVAYRMIAASPNPVAQISSVNATSPEGVKVEQSAALIPVQYATATTATTLQLWAQVVQR